MAKVQDWDLKESEFEQKSQSGSHNNEGVLYIYDVVANVPTCDIMVSMYEI